jgi:hypothetical protein
VAAVTGAGSASAAVIGADNTYVYYDVTTPDYPNYVHAYAASATGTINSGAWIDGVNAFFTFAGVIGTSLFGREREFCSDCMEMCTITPVGAGSCNGFDPDTPGTGLGSGALVAFKNSSQPYFATDSENYLGNTRAITWYHANNSTLAQTFSESVTASSWGYSTMFAYGSVVYWIRVLYDASNAVTQAILYSASADRPGAKTTLSANMGVNTYRIFDANALSVLLTGPYGAGEGLYRVVPPGNPGALPPLLVNVGTASVTGATEDATGVYWLQSDDGKLYRCTPPGCADKKALATGQTPVGDLYQNDAAIFWSNNGVIMRLAK